MKSSNLVPEILTIDGVSASYKKAITEFPDRIERLCSKLKVLSPHSCVMNLAKSEIIDYRYNEKHSLDGYHLCLTDNEEDDFPFCLDKTLEEAAIEGIVATYATFASTQQFIAGSCWPTTLGDNQPIFLVAEFYINNKATIRILGDIGTPMWKKSLTKYKATWQQVVDRLVELHRQVAEKLG